MNVDLQKDEKAAAMATSVQFGALQSAREIIDQEAKARREKTAKLKQLRMTRDEGAKPLASPEKKKPRQSKR